jgi:HEPN domain-containing protein
MIERPDRATGTVREWLRYAEEDLGVAERESARGTGAYHTICFLCQAAAEKLLKAHLIGRGWTVERTHGIVALLEFCAEYDPYWRDLAPDGAVLNEYIVAGRYPGDLALEGIGEAEAREALQAVRRIRDRVRQELL